MKCTFYGQSKSVCEVGSRNENGLELFYAGEQPYEPLAKHFSVSMLDSIPKFKLNNTPSILSLNLSASSSDTFHMPSFSSSSSNSLTSMSSCPSISTHLASNNKPQRPAVGRKKKKYRDLTLELVMFTCRRDAQEYSHFNVITAEPDVESTCEDEVDKLWDYESPETTRNEPSPKAHRLKYIAKSKQLKTFCKKQTRSNFSFSTNSIVKSNRILCIKYNLYKRLPLPCYVPCKQRMSYELSNRKVDARHRLDAAFIAESKSFYKSIKLVQFLTDDASRKKNGADQDARVVVDNALAHNTASVQDEFDPQYLEFLIQLQHRDITPEDYEHLSRLDEFISKKTVDDSVIASLRTVTVTPELLEQIQRDQEMCGVCFDSYSLEQTIIYLPCEHRFHAECIEKWLRNSSVNCPLDNLPIDNNIQLAETEAQPDLDLLDQRNHDEIRNLLNQLVDCVAEVHSVVDDCLCYLDSQ